ncbi:site-specific integrase [Flavobacterium sp. MK4S-17]|uniref:site-specific integrase n=1 Tax=Flavobacterium sp. MK4S-17 TaxID=2543737 RepID=UPI00135BAE5C|nr:site-specific integrase [Flavobacterium sp. MK4S-17]
MANVRFNLKNRNEKETLVVLVFRYDGKKFVYSTGQKINPEYWNDEEQKARNNRNFKGAVEFNAYLEKLRYHTQDIYRKHLNDSKPLSLKDFKAELDIALEKEQRKEKPSLLQFIDEFIKRKEEAGKPYGSIQVYKKTLKHLTDYTKKYGVVNYEDIDIDFLGKFTNFLYSAPRSFSVNYSLKLIQNLKLFMNEAAEYGYHINNAYNSRKFTIKKEDVTHIYLSTDELEKIYNEDLTTNQKLDRVRDTFIVGCLTGLRFSDFSKIQPQHIKKVGNVEVLEIVTQKTRQKVTIPISSKVRAILNKYNGVMPRPISNQKMNKYLKDLGEKVKINDNVVSVRTVGGIRTEIVQKKYELISTHTARRSFATNSFKAGVPVISIKKITGHSTEASFLQYIKISSEENAVLMAQNDFFK